MNAPSLILFLVITIFSGSSWAGRSNGDINEDGRVELQDFLILEELNDAVREDFLVIANNWHRFSGPGKIIDTEFKTAETKKISGTIGLDLFPGSPRFHSSSGNDIFEDDIDIDVQREALVGEKISALIRVNRAEDLIGVGFSLEFNRQRLRVVSFRETQMDLNANGTQDLVEKQAIEELFHSNTDPSARRTDLFTFRFYDGQFSTTVQAGVLLDHNRNGLFDATEFTNYIAEFERNLAGDDIPFWTERVTRREGYNESFERPLNIDEMNATGRADDCMALLLRRQGRERVGFGWDGGAILYEIVFETILPGPAEIKLTNVIGVDEVFQDLEDVGVFEEVLDSTVDVYEVFTPTATPTIVPTETPLSATSTPTRHSAVIALEVIENSRKSNIGSEAIFDLLLKWMR
jgi:hypothetical protein